MRATLIKDLRLLARTPAFRAVIAGYGLATCAAALYAYDFTSLDRASLPRAFFAAQWALLTLVAPWVVSRLTSRERGNLLADLAARSVGSPRVMVAGKTAAAAIFLGELLAVSLPAAAVVYVSAPVTIATMALSYAELVVFVVLASLVGVHWAIGDEDRLRSWALATLTSIATAAAYARLAQTAGTAVALAAFTAAIFVTAWSLSSRSDRRLRYLRT